MKQTRDCAISPKSAFNFDSIRYSNSYFYLTTQLNSSMTESTKHFTLLAENSKENHFFILIMEFLIARKKNQKMLLILVHLDIQTQFPRNYMFDFFIRENSPKTTTCGGVQKRLPVEEALIGKFLLLFRGSECGLPNLQ